ncbi:MAG: 3TM-type holin [Pseudomonadales bacterium]
MGWLSKIFSSTGVNVITSVGKVIDDLVTSDEEIALTDIQKSKIKAAYNVKMQELMTTLDQQAAEHEEKMENELTERLKLDMKSDSWLSKNIRPMALIFMTVVVAILAFFTIFNKTLTGEQLTTLQAWIPFFQTIMLVIYGFYFGSRGLEKIQKIRASNQAGTGRTGTVLPHEQEPRG